MAASGGQTNRLFILLAVGLLGLVCVGLLGLGGVIYMFWWQQAEQAALPTATPVIMLPTVTSTATSTATPTETPLPTPTSTLVVNNNAQEVAAPDLAASDTPTVETAPPVDSTPTATSMLPNAPTPVEPTPTNTLVIQTSQPEITSTPVAVPESGDVRPARNADFLLWAGVMVVLLLLALGVISRFKLPLS